MMRLRLTLRIILVSLFAASLAAQEKAAQEHRTSAPVLVKQVEPRDACQPGGQPLSGEVVLNAYLDEKGKLSQVRVIHGLTPRMNQAAIEAVQQYQLKPARKDGVPVGMTMGFAIPFDCQ